MDLQTPLSFDDPVPAVLREKRKQQVIWILPSLRAEIDQRRGKLSRSAWIEQALLREIARRDGQQ